MYGKNIGFLVERNIAKGKVITDATIAYFLAKGFKFINPMPTIIHNALIRNIPIPIITGTRP